jgi:hypothetical protein
MGGRDRKKVLAPMARSTIMAAWKLMLTLHLLDWQ